MKKPKHGRQHPDQSSQTSVLLATDQHNSVLAELKNDDLNEVRYSAYGHRSAELNPAASMAFNGEFREPDTGWYLLGNGYRAYNPVLMRFHSPDSLSPFGEGGLNPYIYCIGDPVNYSDPTGHFILSFRVWMGGVMLGAAAVSLTLGMSLPEGKKRDIALGFTYGFTALAVAVPIGMTGYTRYIRPRLRAARTVVSQQRIPVELQLHRINSAPEQTRGELVTRPHLPRAPSAQGSFVGRTNPLSASRGSSSSSEDYFFATPPRLSATESGSSWVHQTQPPSRQLNLFASRDSVRK
jgi:RHS repeat-associated protein